MGFKEKLPYVAAAVMLIALVFNIASVAGRGWIKATPKDLPEDTFKVEMGLWSSCLTSGGNTDCSDVKCDDSTSERECSDLKLTRAGMIIATVASGFSILLVFASAYTQNPSRHAILTMVVAATMGFMAMCSGADMYTQIKSDVENSVPAGFGVNVVPSWGFALCIVAWVFGGIATAAFVVGQSTFNTSTSSKPGEFSRLTGA